MTIDVESLQEFSPAELLKLVRVAIAEQLQYGRIITVRNKTLQAASLFELQQLENTLESKTAASRGRIRNFVRRRRS